MKKLFTPPLKKFNLCSILGLAMVILIFNSCKKELYVAEKIDQEQLKKIHSYQNGAKLNIINFSQFKSKANLQSLGALKDIFLSPTAGKGKLMSVNIPETYNGFAIQTDSIKVLNANGHTSYIFPVKLSSPNAITFQNLTIDESAKGTVVFVNTYKPTQKWIDDWKKGKKGKFDGDISVSYLTGSQNSSTPISTHSSNGKIAAINDKVALVDANGCNVTNYYFELPYNCGSGMHEPYDSGCYLTGDDRAGIALINFEVTVCGGGGGGGGSTSPNPPGDYNPCDGEAPIVRNTATNGAKGDKLMVAENNPCDDEPLPTLHDERLPEDTDEIRSFEVDYKQQMSAAELAIYNNMSRADQISYLINAKTALDIAVTRFPNMSQTDTKADAFRHAYFSLLNVRELGLALATSLGNAHEENSNQSALAKQMDLFNNNIGRNAYTNLPSEAAYWNIYSNVAYSLVTNGSLRYINNGQLKPTNQ
ncbi:MAG: hypothetical protein EOO93_12785 [Pedobacter sp.]|nr:MAG: hypothetical protein EOO93_12785 [Pedobacter sp.]